MKKQTSKRTNVIRALLLSGTIISMFFVPWPIVKAWLKPLPDTVQEQLAEATDDYFDGMIVYVDRADKSPESYAAGWHEPVAQIPAKPEAYWKIASIRKLYVAVAIAKLAGDEIISLDNSLAHYMPPLEGRIEHANEITLRMMVQHRSGIPNFTDTPGFWSSPGETNAENLALVLDMPANFKPDKRYEYSNTNYLLLSDIMDSVLGYPHFEFIQSEILDRLDLKNTFQSVTSVDTNDVMSGYYVGYPYDLKSADQGMVATAEDVGIFIRALNDGSLFDEGEQEIYSSIYRYEHTGLVPGYQSIARYHKDIDAVVIQFTTPTDFEDYHWSMAELYYRRIVKILRKRSEE